MCIRRVLSFALLSIALLGISSPGRAQGVTDASRWALDFGVGIAPSVNGNVNSGAIGTIQGLATAILPNSYSDVYGSGLDFRFGGAYRLGELSEIRGMFVWQSADANLVRLGDIGPSPLYAQYSDYKTFGLDVGYRRYVQLSSQKFRVYGEATIGIASVDRINVQFAAPQSNAIFNDTDFYDGTAAFTWSIGGGILFPIASQLDVNAQLGLRHVGGLSEVDQFVGTSLSTINNDSARLTFPIIVGIRYRFK